MESNASPSLMEIGYNSHIKCWRLKVKWKKFNYTFLRNIPKIKLPQKVKKEKEYMN